MLLLGCPLTENLPQRQKIAATPSTNQANTLIF